MALNDKKLIAPFTLTKNCNSRLKFVEIVLSFRASKETNVWSFFYTFRRDSSFHLVLFCECILLLFEDNRWFIHPNGYKSKRALKVIRKFRWETQGRQHSRGACIGSWPFCPLRT